MNPRKPLSIIGAALAVVLLLIVVIALTLETRWFSEFLSERLSKKFGQQVEWAAPLAIDWSLTPTLRVEQLRIENPDWAEHDAFATADAIVTRLDLPKLFRGLIAVELLQLKKPTVHLMQSAEHGSNWAFLLPEEDVDDALFDFRLEELLLEGGEVTFIAPAQKTDIAVRIDSHDGNELSVQGDGLLQGEPLELVLGGEPLYQDVDHVVTEDGPKGAYALAGHLEWRDHSLRLRGATDSLTALGELQLEVQARGPDANALLPLKASDSEATPYQIQAHVQHQQPTWSVHKLNGHLGDSEFRGQMSYQTGAPRPKISVDLRVSLLNLDDFLKRGVDAETPPPNQPLAHTLNDLLAPLRQYDAAVELRIERLQKQPFSVQNLHASVDLTEGLLSIEPLRLDAGGGRVKLTGQLNAAPDLPQGAAALTLQTVNLGQALGEAGYSYLGSIDGELKVELDDQALRLAESQLRYWEAQSETDVEVHISRQEVGNSPHGVQITASGEINGSALDLSFVGGPLLDIDTPDTAYPLEADLTVAETALTLTGTVTQILRIRGADLAIHLSGPGSAQLNRLPGIDLPALPAYQFDARLLSESEAWHLRNIRGEMGDSDLTGDVQWTVNDEKRHALRADLHSEHLDFDTLTSLNDQRQENKAAEAVEDEQVIPDEEFPSKQLQGFDARIKYDADNVVASGVPLDNIVMDLKLNEGILELAPLSFGIGRGAINLKLRADTTAQPTGGHFSIELSRININDVLEPFELVNDSYGRLGGKGEFNFSGASPAQALANLQGELQLVMTGGQLSATLQAAAELDGGDLLLSLLGDADTVDIRCAYAQLDANSGVVDIESLTLATAESHILGDGSVNFENETFELVIEANPKEFSVLQVSAPLRFHGSFEEPQIDVVSDELLGRGALAAIGAAVFPPAALLPLVEPGDAEEGGTGCEEAVKSAESMAAQQE